MGKIANRQSLAILNRGLKSQPFSQFCCIGMFKTNRQSRVSNRSFKSQGRQRFESRVFKSLAILSIWIARFRPSKLLREPGPYVLRDTSGVLTTEAPNGAMIWRGAKRMGRGKRTRERGLPKISRPLLKSFWSAQSWNLYRKNRAMTPERGVETYQTKVCPKPLLGRRVLREVFLPPLFFHPPPWRPLTQALNRQLERMDGRADAPVVGTEAPVRGPDSPLNRRNGF